MESNHPQGLQTVDKARPTQAPIEAHPLTPAPRRSPAGLPAELAAVALIDAPRCAQAACISVSTWHELVRRGDAPAPAMRAPRCTRWRLADVADWLRARAARGSDPQAEAAVMRAARAGTRAAQAKRQRVKTGEA